MAYSEIVLFIREQLTRGKDARAIRDYLIRRNIDPKSIDSAFDEVFSKKQTTHDNNHVAGKVVVIGLVILVFVFIGIGAKFYFGISPPLVPEADTEKLVPQTPIQEESMVSICDFEDTEEKYDCYLSKFENDEIQCHEIDDPDEEKFCYRAQDLYVLSA